MGEGSPAANTLWHAAWLWSFNNPKDEAMIPASTSYEKLKRQAMRLMLTGKVEQYMQSLHDLRIAEVVDLDMQIEEGKVLAYRAKVKVSFK